MSKRYWSKGRSVSDLKVHLVLTTKYRKRVLTKAMVDYIGDHLHQLFEKWDCEIIEYNGEDNHVHILFQYHPDIQLSKLIGNVKAATSRKAREKFSDKLSQTYMKGAFWNSSYFVGSCGGVTISQLKAYINGQNTPE